MPKPRYVWRKAHYVWIIAIVLIPIGPFLVAMGINEYRLHRFAAQLDDVSFPTPSRVLSRGSSFYPGTGSAPDCVFEATLVVRTYGGADMNEEFADALRQTKFKSPRIAEDGSHPDVEVIVDGSIIVLNVTAGPWDSMDPRCL
tara:strand:+ start:393 stop:821 length:429 start_codon:yes stop_codon:yes gene_type:complete